MQSESPHGEDTSVPGALPAKAHSQGEGAGSQAGELKDKARTLVKNRGRKLNLVDNRTLFPTIQESVMRSLESYLPGVDKSIARQIAVTSRENMVQLLRDRARQIRGLSENAFLKKVKASRDRIVNQREQAKGQLAGLLGDLSTKRHELNVRQQMLTTESAAKGAVENKMLREELEKAFSGMAVGDDIDLKILLERVTNIAVGGMDGERAKVVEARVAEHQREVAKFERRISKLTESLQVTEEEMKRIAAAKGIESGVASLYRKVQGLDGGDSHFEQKKELMSGIFEANLKLHEKLK